MSVSAHISDPPMKVMELAALAARLDAHPVADRLEQEIAALEQQLTEKLIQLGQVEIEAGYRPDEFVSTKAGHFLELKRQSRIVHGQAEWFRYVPRDQLLDTLPIEEDADGDMYMLGRIVDVSFSLELHMRTFPLSNNELTFELTDLPGYQWATLTLTFRCNPRTQRIGIRYLDLCRQPRSLAPPLQRSKSA